MLRQLYDWTIALGQTRYALWALAIVAFVESSVFPIPPDVLMIPMILAAPHRAFVIAALCTTASVLGGIAGYWIGFAAYEEVGRPVLESLGKGASMEAFNERFTDFGFWPVLIAGVTPFPYKVITIMSGWTSLPLGTFIVTSIIARGMRFFLVAWLLWYYGDSIRAFIERRLGLVFILFCLLLGGGFAVVAYL